MALEAPIPRRSEPRHSANAALISEDLEGVTVRSRAFSDSTAVSSQVRTTPPAPGPGQRVVRSLLSPTVSVSRANGATLPLRSARVAGSGYAAVASARSVGYPSVDYPTASVKPMSRYSNVAQTLSVPSHTADQPTALSLSLPSSSQLPSSVQRCISPIVLQSSSTSQGAVQPVRMEVSSLPIKARSAAVAVPLPQASVSATGPRVGFAQAPEVTYVPLASPSPSPVPVTVVRPRSILSTSPKTSPEDDSTPGSVSGGRRRVTFGMRYSREIDSNDLWNERRVTQVEEDKEVEKVRQWYREVEMCRDGSNGDASTAADSASNGDTFMTRRTRSASYGGEEDFGMNGGDLSLSSAGPMRSRASSMLGDADCPAEPMRIRVSSAQSDEADGGMDAFGLGLGPARRRADSNMEDVSWVRCQSPDGFGIGPARRRAHSAYDL